MCLKPRNYGDFKSPLLGLAFRRLFTFSLPLECRPAPLGAGLKETAPRQPTLACEVSLSYLFVSPPYSTSSCDLKVASLGACKLTLASIYYLPTKFHKRKKLKQKFSALSIIYLSLLYVFSLLFFCLAFSVI